MTSFLPGFSQPNHTRQITLSGWASDYPGAANFVLPLTACPPTLARLGDNVEASNWSRFCSPATNNPFLSKRINLSGGNIRNVVVNAAFLAAENSGVIDMKHFLHAVRREYEKIGRLCTEADFAPYHNLLKGR